MEVSMRSCSQRLSSVRSREEPSRKRVSSRLMVVAVFMLDETEHLPPAFVDCLDGNLQSVVAMVDQNLYFGRQAHTDL